MKNDGLKKLFVVAAAAVTLGLSGCATNDTLGGTFNSAADSVSDFFGGIRDSVGMGDKQPKLIGPRTWQVNGVNVGLREDTCIVANAAGSAMYYTKGRDLGTVVIKKAPTNGQIALTYTVKQNKDVFVQTAPNEPVEKVARIPQTESLYNSLMRQYASTVGFCNQTIELERRGALPGTTPQAPTATAAPAPAAPASPTTPIKGSKTSPAATLKK